MDKASLLNKKWYLVSYDSLRTSLVGGNRINRLNQFLKKEQIDSLLISREIAPKEGLRIDEFGFVRFLKKILGGFLVDPSLLWAFKVFFWVRKFPDDFVLLTSAPPFGISFLGFLLRIRGKKFYWIADFRDPWTLNPLYNPFLFGKFFSGFFEKFVFRKADLVIFNTPTDQSNYQNKYFFLSEKSIVVRNGFERIVKNSNSPEETETLKIVYSGGAYPKAMAAQNVVNFVEKINRAGFPVICDYFGEYSSVLSKSDYISYKGRVSQNEVPKILSNYKIGLIYLQEECLGGGRVTQKFYDYLGSGVMPLVINPSGEMIQMMSDLETGIALFSKTDLRSVIPGILSAEFSSNDPKNLEKLQTYSNKYQFEKLLKHVS